jgi:RNA polymerase sigma-70 factor, ECF subfamily
VNIRPGQGSKQEQVTAVERLKTPDVQDVIDRCVGGDERAWRELHRDYHGVAARFLRRMGIPAAELDDACQEVFVQVFRYMARFERRAEFQTWLYKLCLSQANRSRRRWRIRQARDWLMGHEATVHPNTGQPGWSEPELVRKVSHVLARMKAIHREVFVLFELEGLEGEAIAHILGCPPATVRRRLHYARTEFEALLCSETENGKS